MDIARRNIERRLEVIFPRATGITERLERFEPMSDVGSETVRKFLHAEQNPRLDILVKIADGLSLTMAELFTEGGLAKELPATEGNPRPGPLQRRSD